MHLETVVVGGYTYCLLKKDTPADAGFQETTITMTGTGRFWMKRFVIQLSHVGKILASTWTVYYRAYKTGGTVHMDVNILILKSDGTTRTSIASDVANSPNLGTSYSTVSGTFNFPEYTIVDVTDWLRIDVFAHVTTYSVKKVVYYRFDERSLPQADQSRVTNVSFVAPCGMQLVVTPL